MVFSLGNNATSHTDSSPSGSANSMKLQGVCLPTYLVVHDPGHDSVMHIDQAVGPRNEESAMNCENSLTVSFAILSRYV